MIKVLLILFLNLSFCFTAFENTCSAWGVYHDKKTDVNFFWAAPFEEEFKNIFQPSLVLFIENEKYIVAVYYNDKIKEENIPKKFVKSLQESIQVNKGDVGLFVLTEPNTCSLSVYVKTTNNEHRDISVLEKTEFDIFARKYARLIEQEGFENVNVVNTGSFENRKLTIELSGFRVKDSKALVKRVISRYGKIIELNAIFEVPIEQRWQISKYLKGVNQYLDAIAENIDYDNCAYVDDETEEFNKKLWRDI